jgi:putative ABC transport system ATP-binding protein
VLTAVENVALPTVFAGTPTREGYKKAEKLLEMVGLKDRIHHRPGELSAGQQQRVAIARALANDPAIILADEPTGNLDLNTGMEIIDLLHGLNKSQGLTLIAATHDLKMIKASDRIVWMRDGQVEKIERS